MHELTQELYGNLGTLLASIDYRDPIWIIVAYLFGFIVWQIGLPPLVGFLLAGFVLNMAGASGGEFIHEMADLGVTLLLFTIGLKLNVRQLLRPEVWGVATAHMGAISLGIGALLWLLAGFGIPLLTGLTPASALLLGFALSFSSTVFAVKVFENKGGMGSQYGRVTIGVLIVQDIAAVVFLAASTAKLPSPWAAVTLLGLLASRPLLVLLLKRAGHGELLILYGLVLALGGSTLFELVGLKGDLGALFFGVLLAQHPKASELAKALLSLKDLFLVGFFLSIGMAVTPSWATAGVASLLLLLIPAKTLLFHVLFARFRLRTRNATLASLALANFSEFGLIVGAIAVSNQWLAQEWLAVLAIAVVLSFIIASPLNIYANSVCQRLCPWLYRLEHNQRLPEDTPLHLGNTRTLICGMGRIGSGAYRQLENSDNQGTVIGVDFDDDKVKRHQQVGHHVLHGDCSSPEFWHRIHPDEQHLETLLLCMPNHQANLKTAEAARAWGFKGHVSAVIKYPEEAPQLDKVGVNSVFNIYAELGGSFAQNVQHKLANSEGKTGY